MLTGTAAPPAGLASRDARTGHSQRPRSRPEGSRLSWARSYWAGRNQAFLLMLHPMLRAPYIREESGTPNGAMDRE